MIASYGREQSVPTIVDNLALVIWKHVAHRAKGIRIEDFNQQRRSVAVDGLHRATDHAMLMFFHINLDCTHAR
jgi:hypothetical protein